MKEREQKTDLAAAAKEETGPAEKDADLVDPGQTKTEESSDDKASDTEESDEKNQDEDNSDGDNSEIEDESEADTDDETADDAEEADEVSEDELDETNWMMEDADAVAVASESSAADFTISGTTLRALKIRSLALSASRIKTAPKFTADVKSVTLFESVAGAAYAKDITFTGSGSQWGTGLCDVKSKLS